MHAKAHVMSSNLLYIYLYIYLLVQKWKQANKDPPENNPQQSKSVLAWKTKKIDLPEARPEAAQQVCGACSLLALHDLKAM